MQLAVVGEANVQAGRNTHAEDKHQEHADPEVGVEVETADHEKMQKNTQPADWLSAVNVSKFCEGTATNDNSK